MRFVNTIIWGLLLVMFFNLLFLTSGCEPKDKIKKCAFISYDDQFYELINKRKDYSKYKYKRVQVFYEMGLDEQARLLAPLTEELVLFVERELNLQLNISELNLFLFNAKDECVISGEENIFSGTGFKSHGQKALLSLFIPENANLESILIKNSPIYPGVLFHELVEGKLASRIQVNFKSTKDNAESMQLTRWFREGFSDYAGYIAFQHLLEKINIPAKANKTLLYNGYHRNPFSELAKIGKNLFKWPQLNTYSIEVNIDHYDAAFGLFLLLEDTYGTKAIAKIVEEIDNLHHADGKVIIKLCNDVIGTDIVELANSFYFPDFGIEKKALFPIGNMEVPYGIRVKKVFPESIAQKAGIQEKDIIIMVDRKDISTEFEFEYAIFKSLNKQQIPIKVWRSNEGTLSFMLDMK